MYYGYLIFNRPGGLFLINNSSYWYMIFGNLAFINLVVSKNPTGKKKNGSGEVGRGEEATTISLPGSSWFFPFLWMCQFLTIFIIYFFQFFWVFSPFHPISPVSSSLFFKFNSRSVALIALALFIQKSSNLYFSSPGKTLRWLQDQAKVMNFL